jgi:hypothetical protein
VSVHRTEAPAGFSLSGEVGTHGVVWFRMAEQGIHCFQCWCSQDPWPSRVSGITFLNLLYQATLWHWQSGETMMQTYMNESVGKQWVSILSLTLYVMTPSSLPHPIWPCWETEVVHISMNRFCTFVVHSYLPVTQSDPLSFLFYYCHWCPTCTDFEFCLPQSHFQTSKSMICEYVQLAFILFVIYVLFVMKWVP